MNAGRLLVVCGAGLSMAAPSNLPSARAVAERCFDKYRLESDPNCDIALRSDLEALAEHFAGMNTPRSVFIEHLVPWHAFVRPSNAGHAAIADFLITRAAIAGISSNYDALIERRAWDYGSDFQGSLDGDEATVDAIHRGPLAEIPRMLSSRSPFNDLGAFSADRTDDCRVAGNARPQNPQAPIDESKTANTARHRRNPPHWRRLPQDSMALAGQPLAGLAESAGASLGRGLSGVAVDHCHRMGATLERLAICGLAARLFLCSANSPAGARFCARKSFHDHHVQGLPYRCF